MINKYYQQQLTALKQEGKKFAAKHPAIASMLSGENSDPDVERLLEGSAFLSGIVQQRLDDDFPEIVHSLVQMLFPHYLRPLPAASVVRFKPRPGLMEASKVKAGTELASVPAEGMKCLFTTRRDLTLFPLSITNISQNRQALEISISVNNNYLKCLNEDKLSFFIADSYNAASSIYANLYQYTKAVSLCADGEEIYLHRSEGLEMLDLYKDEGLFPYPSQAFPAFKNVQAYFQLPHSFLFFKIKGLSRLVAKKPKAKQFTIYMHLDDLIDLNISKDSLALFCVPVVNLFKSNANSIHLNHKIPEYRIIPAGGKEIQIYSVDEVIGFEQGSIKKKHYQSFEKSGAISKNLPLYSLMRRLADDEHASDMFLSVPYAEKRSELIDETLTLSLTCTNGRKTEKIKLGDIREPTDSSPVLAEFENIIQVSKEVVPPLNSNLLWRMLTHLYLNQTSVTKVENLVSLLNLYIFPGTYDRNWVVANTKRVESIKNITSKNSKRLYQGVLVRGVDITVTLDPHGFSGEGDMFLFGQILNNLLSAYSSMNHYTKLIVEGHFGKERFVWPPQSGSRILL